MALAVLVAHSLTHAVTHARTQSLARSLIRSLGGARSACAESGAVCSGVIPLD